jgi:hypothetical protein
MNSPGELMQFLMRPLREMTNEKKQMIEQLISIDNNLEKLQKTQIESVIIWALYG